jgi:plastocyanin
MSALAITMSGMALATAFTQPAATSNVTPRSVAMTLVLDEGQVVTGWNDTCNCAVQLDTPSADSEVIAGEYVRWAPSTLVMNAGDTLTLTIKNPRGGDHGFLIEAQAGDFSGTTAAASIQGRRNSGNPEGTSAVITFTALKPGTYTYICPLPFDDAVNHCHPDHDTITGTLIVL